MSTIKLNNFNFEGQSIASVYTSIYIKELRTMIDIGYYNPEFINAEKVLLTHTHIDHIPGLISLIGQRGIEKRKALDIFINDTSAIKLQNMIKAYESLDDNKFDYNIIENTNDLIPLMENTNYYFKAQESFHRVMSNAYTIFTKKTKLKNEFIGKTPNELIELKKSTTINEIIYIPVISFSGDTDIRILDNQDIINSNILFLECTFLELDSRVTIETINKSMHICLDQINENIDKLKNVQHLVLYHFSKRYTNEQIRKIISEKLDKSLLEKTTLFL